MDEGRRFGGRLGLQQRVLPAYRAPFFDLLAGACDGGLSVFAGEPREEEAILPTDRLEIARLSPARNRDLLSGRAYLCLQPNILSWLEQWDPHALILEANPRLLSNGRASAWMRARRRPVLGWGLGAPDVYGPLRGFRRWIRRRTLSRFDGLIAYSTLGAEQYRSIGFPASRVYVALNAVVLPPPRLAERAAPAGRRPRVLFVGRLQTRKRIDLLLEACASLDPRPDLWIVGDGPALLDLQRQASRLHLEAQFAGALHGPSLESVFGRADLFVLPGTGGLAVQEAMAHGLPIIAAEGDGTQDDLVRPENGWLVPEGDLASLTDALRRALREPSRLVEMGRASHRIVAEEVNIEAMVASFVRALAAVSGAEG
jgi:glycosyltransferase involved in cell wall biosynthesis